MDQVGGAFADSSATWRWGFYINLVIFVVSAPAMLFTLPSIDLGAELTWRERASRFDWLGCGVFCGWCIAFIMAINFGGTHYPWDSADEITLWVFTGVLLPVFALTQWFHPFVAREFRLYPTQLLRNWRFMVLQICAFAGAGVTYVGTPFCALFIRSLVTPTDPHLLHPAVLPVRPWRIIARGCCTPLTLCLHGGLLLPGKRLLDEPGRLHQSLVHRWLCSRPSRGGDAV